MWKVFPKIGLLKVVFSIFSALFLAGLILIVGSNQAAGLTWDNFGAGFRVATPITLFFIGFIYIAGK